MARLGVLASQHTPLLLVSSRLSDILNSFIKANPQQNPVDQAVEEEEEAHNTLQIAKQTAKPCPVRLRDPSLTHFTPIRLST